MQDDLLQFESNSLQIIQKRDMWTKLYKKYFDKFKEECDLMEDEGIKEIKDYYHEKILPITFNYSVEIHCSSSFDDS